MPYDVRRLTAIELGTAEISDNDAVVELVAGLVETMVRGHPRPSPRLEERYRTQVRALRTITRRKGLDADIPPGLRVWLEACPSRATPSQIRVAAEALFDPLLGAIDGHHEFADRSDDPLQHSERAPQPPPPPVTQPVGATAQSADASPPARLSAETVAASPRVSSSLPLLAGLSRWLARENPRVGDYIAATLIVTIIGGVLVAVLTHESQSSNGRASNVEGVKSSSPSGARVYLAQGKKGTAGYGYAISVSGFGSHRAVSISCRDNRSPDGYKTFSITTDSAGSASLAETPCYSNTSTEGWVTADGVGSNHVQWTATAVATVFHETTGGQANTWSNYMSAGGILGPLIGSNRKVEVACAVVGFKVADGNTWWYRIASPPWNGSYYASADAFYNDGRTSGGLAGTPFVDPLVPKC